MPVQTTALSPLRAAEVAAALRQVMPDLYFINTSTAQMRLHLGLLVKLPQQDLLLDFQQRRGSPLTELTVCAYDDAQPGLLAKLCGTLSALRINVQTAFVYTLRLPADVGQLLASPAGKVTDGRPVVLDTLLLNEPYGWSQRALSSATVQKVQQELTAILSGESTVAQLLAKSRRRPYPPLRLHEVSALPNATGGQTIIKLRAHDAPGVLYRTTAALARLGLDIQVAQINTANRQIDDIFYVTDSHGQALGDDDLEGLCERLRTALQDQLSTAVSLEGPPMRR